MGDNLPECLNHVRLWIIYANVSANAEIQATICGKETPELFVRGYDHRQTPSGPYWGRLID